MIEELPEEYLKDKAFHYVYPIASSIGWNNKKIKESLKAYNAIKIEGPRAGTSLRLIISDLHKLSSDAALIISKYKLPYDCLNPEKSSLIEALATFVSYEVPSIDVFYFFGCRPHGLDFIDLMCAYRRGLLE
jgi:hypothetical protein